MFEKNRKEVLFGDLDEMGIEVGVTLGGELYIADVRSVDYMDDTAENREKCIKEAKNIIAEWNSGR